MKQQTLLAYVGIDSRGNEFVKQLMVPRKEVVAGSGCVGDGGGGRGSNSADSIARSVGIHIVIVVNVLEIVLVIVLLVDNTTSTDVLRDLFHAAVCPDTEPLDLATERLGLLAGGLLGELLALELLDVLTSLLGELGQPPLLGTAQAGEQVLVLGDELAGGGDLAGALAGHAALVEDALAALADLRDALHGLDRLLEELAVVADGHVAAGGELQGAVDHHLLAGVLAVGLGPLELAGVALHLEVLVALGSAEAERLACTLPRWLASTH